MADTHDKAAAEKAAAAKKANASGLTVDQKKAKIAELQAEIDALDAPTPIEFPKMVYHPDFPARVVNSREEQDQLNADQPGWVETLADVPKDATVQTGPKTAASGMPSDSAAHAPRHIPKAKEKD